MYAFITTPSGQRITLTIIPKRDRLNRVFTIDGQDIRWNEANADQWSTQQTFSGEHHTSIVVEHESVSIVMIAHALRACGCGVPDAMFRRRSTTLDRARHRYLSAMTDPANLAASLRSFLPNDHTVTSLQPRDWPKP